MAKDSHKALLDQLKNPFDPKLVKWRQGGGGKQLAYVDARDVMKRLDDVMGIAGWQDKYKPVDGGMICELSLKINGEWITKSNGANNTKVEAVKGGISSALKRAAVEWGIGRYLYYINPDKFNRSNVAQWPKWALPNNSIQNWEDVAELEADENTGMDEVEDVVVQALDIADNIRQADNTKDLKKIVDKLSADEQRIFADIIANKTQELVSGNDKAEA